MIFIWQFLSWAMLNLHKSNQKYTPQQDTILQFLGTQLKEEGTYFLPTVAPGTSQEDAQKQMEASAGKPWAQVSYHASMSTDMGMNMLRGFLSDVLAVFILIWLLMKIPELTMSTSILASVGIGLIGYLTTEYSNHIWFQTNSLPDLMDAVFAWVLCGTWLGYWLNR